MNKYSKISTLSKYNALIRSGYFFELFPELIGDWVEDYDIIQEAITNDFLSGDYLDEELMNE